MLAHLQKTIRSQKDKYCFGWGKGDLDFRLVLLRMLRIAALFCWEDILGWFFNASSSLFMSAFVGVMFTETFFGVAFFSSSSAGGCCWTTCRLSFGFASFSPETSLTPFSNSATVTFSFPISLTLDVHSIRYYTLFSIAFAVTFFISLILIC